jgi:hypothetical protein
MKTRILTVIAVTTLVMVAQARAQVPGIINYQGRVVDAGTNFNGTGQFEFAIVNAAGTTNYWSNDGTAAGQPSAAVSLAVTKGLYSVLLGDTTIANMSVALSPAVFANPDVRLRVWFNDNVNGFQQLAPDQRLGAVGYALNAASLATPSGGDLSGPVTNLTVAKLQGSPLAVPAPSTGQVLRYNGTSWTNSAIQSGDLPSINSVSNFTASLVGDVTGPQGATVVSLVGGVSAANVASGANAANSATSANTAGAIVKRDGSGNIIVGTITGALNGNATSATSATTASSATTAGSATTAISFSGSLAGDVTGPQNNTAIANGAVTAAKIASGAVGPTQLAGQVVTNNASGVTLSGNLNAANGLVIEDRTSDPGSPAVGQLWLRTDL